MLVRLHPDYPTLFPNPEDADAEGLLAIGGDLSPERLLAGYQAGIFPWYSEGQPLLWWSPDPRCVLLPDAFRIPQTVRKELRRCRFRVSMNTAFRAVMEGCAQTPRQGQPGTWIVPEMIEAYCTLHQLGFAHSVEVWEDAALPADQDSARTQGSTDEAASEDRVVSIIPEQTERPSASRLVGGLYGVALGRVFFGESMFHTEAHASKLALVTLMEKVRACGIELVDCQMATSHIMRYGAQEIPRQAFLERLRQALRTQEKAE